ncbi:F-box/FBD/LRR-repeat protein At1g13570-like [Bidens hawaiensis]|uniref:F-box/FBD/LRR-repeat protein At1g13570-like n=1 Tax=Bidens hawaiensis TaxID=980011 RepID=UPI00404B34D0
MTDLTLVKSTGIPLKLPSNLFSCLGLKHLKLSYCCFCPPTSFNGFPNLLSVDLSNVEFERTQFGEFITKCPVLEILKVGDPGKVNLQITMKVDQIAKLVNLKTLSMCLRDFENNAITSFTTIFELLGCLPRLQELHLDCLRSGGAIERIPTTFSCLKALELSQIDLSNVIILSCVFDMIRHFPNLQTLNIKAHNWIADPVPLPEVEYSTTRLRHVVFTDFPGSENEVCLLKYILACSPFLRKIVMRPLWRVTTGEQLMFTKKLLKLHRASTAAEIDFN